MTGYNASDMATRGADGFRDGYRAGCADASGAAQEAVAWQYQRIGSGRWIDCNKRYYEHAKNDPLFITRELVERAVAAAPSAEAVELTVCCGREECGGECGNEWRGTEWVRKAATPAAPGIDLEQFREAVQGWRDSASNEQADGLISMAEWLVIADRADRLLALIYASPKGVTLHNDGSSEAQFIADTERLNCPACGGSGHVDDSPKGGSTDAEPKIWGTQKPGSMPKLFGARHIAELNWYPGEGYDLVCMQVIERVQATSADHESERDFLLSALGRVQEMTKDSHPVAYGIAEHAIECTRRDGDYKV